MGLKPTTLQNAAGSRIEPPVSLPSATVASPAATAATLPPELPPGTRRRSHGLTVLPSALFSHELPIANSSRFVFPSGMAPASSNRCTAVAVYGAIQPSKIFEAHVVGVPVTHMLSLIARPTPASGSDAPLRTAASTRSAAARARSPVRARYAPISPSRSAMRSRALPVSSSAERSRALTERATSSAVRLAITCPHR